MKNSACMARRARRTTRQVAPRTLRGLWVRPIRRQSYSCRRPPMPAAAAATQPVQRLQEASGGGCPGGTVACERDCNVAPLTQATRFMQECGALQGKRLCRWFLSC